jgi:5-methylthioadenosine/S-adenosylhomocysteine deaminase
LPRDPRPTVPLQADLLILGGTLLPMNDAMDVLSDGAVAVKDGRIIAVGERRVLAAGVTATRTIDASGRLVMPGLINTHTHTPMTDLLG